jgi:hypothetical protein
METVKKKISKLATLSITIFLISACATKHEREVENKLKEVKEKYSCISVDDCLSKYDFEAARAFMGADGSQYDNLPKITTAESIFLAKKGEFERAISVIDEANHVNYYEHEKQELKYTIYDMAVTSLLEKSEYNQAKKWAMRSSDLHSTKGWTKDEKSSHWSKDETQRAVLLEKIKEYKKNMQE